MSTLDQFVHSQAAPHLAPGEVVQVTGCLLRATHLTLTLIAGYPVQKAFSHDAWLMAATQTRLILFFTEMDTRMFSAEPKAQNGGMVSISFDTIQEAVVQKIIPTGADRRLTLSFREDMAPEGIAMLGEWSLDMAYRFAPNRKLVFDLAPSIKGLDGQATLHGPFVDWLSQSVAAGMFQPSAETLARAAMTRGARAQYEADVRAREAAKAEKRRRQRPAQLRVAIMAPALIAALVCAGYGISAYDTYSIFSRESQMTTELAELRAGPPPPEWEALERQRRISGLERAILHRERKVGESRVQMIWSLIGACLSLGAFVGLLRAGRRWFPDVT